MLAAAQSDANDLTPRQQAVLNAALQVLATQGERLTMTAVARQAACSKETLYKWFGDRDGLLTATVRWQAAKVRTPVLDGAKLSRDTLRHSLERFARDLLLTLTGDTSIVLNRLAVARAGTDSPQLGGIVLENGPLAMRKRLTPVLQAGRAAALLRFDDADAAFRSFFGLVVADTQIRMLLGDRSVDPAAVEEAALTATGQFLALYGAPTSD